MAIHSAFRNAKAWIAPIVVGRINGPRWKHIDVVGTGFLLTEDIVVTCWHVLSNDLPADDEYLIVPQINGRQHAIVLRDIAQHPNPQIDLASARPQKPIPGDSPFDLSEERRWSFGTQVATLSYPLPEIGQSTTGERTTSVSLRYLEGYVTRDLDLDRPGWGVTPSFEIDMPAPRVSSGGPLMLKGSQVVIGVVYGEHTVETDEGVTRFALAHHTESLHSLAGPATADIPLHHVMMMMRGRTT